MCLNDGHLNKASEQEVTAPSPSTKVNTYVKTNVFTNVHTYVKKNVFTNVHTYVKTNVFTNVHTYVKKNVNTNGNLIKISPFISLIVCFATKTNEERDERANFN